MSCRHIEYLAGLFPHVITENEVSNVRDEWVLYQSDDKVDILEEQSRADHYWHSVFSLKTLVGEKKYPLLEKLVKSILSLHHGNSTVERSLSDNKNTVQNERDHLLEGTIIGLRRMKEYARSKGGAEHVVISERMVKHIIEARKLDEERLRKEREAKEELKRN